MSAAFYRMGDGGRRPEPSRPINWGFPIWFVLLMILWRLGELIDAVKLIGVHK